MTSLPLWRAGEINLGIGHFSPTPYSDKKMETDGDRKRGPSNEQRATNNEQLESAPEVGHV